MKKKVYKKELYDLQVQLVKFQKHVLEKNLQVCLVLEGRDAAGKDGTIKRFTEHLSPREARIVALENLQIKIKCRGIFSVLFSLHLPTGEEIVFF